eukprot:scaffold58725_cov31-Tisochrysis_lutea.AAC.5
MGVFAAQPQRGAAARCISYFVVSLVAWLSAAFTRREETFQGFCFCLTVFTLGVTRAKDKGVVGS